MTIVDMLGQSGTLTLLGMGIVFGFLIIMICTVTVMGKLVHALGVDKNLTGPAPAGVSPPPAGGKDSGAAVTAAISAAVSEYRKTNP